MCRTEGDNTIYFKFHADNGILIEDFSFAAALESMLFGMDPRIVCTGDSNPSLDFNVERNMGEQVISMKLDAFEGSLVYVKADTSTSHAITLPDGVTNLALDFVP